MNIHIAYIFKDGTRLVGWNISLAASDNLLLASTDNKFLAASEKIEDGETAIYYKYITKHKKKCIVRGLKRHENDCAPNHRKIPKLTAKLRRNGTYLLLWNSYSLIRKSTRGEF
ncbi:hypothetical protein GE061_018530 [Apolygus lucorum]|uniref:Uncharacterized protein n=1 Tax=Apolygus lucorum TaxID=248454 RepID=A0A8S9XFH0_APOLU|nr:hypothetical protein GE061_018530 [Apolygus lucorum]